MGLDKTSNPKQREDRESERRVCTQHRTNSRLYKFCSSETLILPTSMMWVSALSVAAAAIACCLLCVGCGAGSVNASLGLRDDRELVQLLWKLRREQRQRQCWKFSFADLNVEELSRCAHRFIHYSNQQLRKWNQKTSLASYHYNIDINDDNKNRMIDINIKSSRFHTKLTLYALKFKNMQLSLTAKDARMLRYLQWNQVYEKKSDSVRLNKLNAELGDRYNLATGCYGPGKCLESGEDSVKNYFRTQYNYEQLQYLWKSWRDATGAKFRGPFLERAKLLNASVRPAGFLNYAYYDYYTDFEDPKFPETVVSLFNQVKPLYVQLHAYLRHRLLQKYPVKFAPNGRLPCHLGNDPWGAQYTKWDREFAPYPDAVSIDFDDILKNREKRGRLTVSQLPHIADEFYRSLGLPRMTQTFWLKSVFEKPKGRNVNCHGTAYQMYDRRKEDFRIKMCTRMDMTSFSTVHHEMGHIMYYMLYSRQPILFQEGANSGFHEAIGDTITLSVKTAKHFKAIEFVRELNDTLESQVNTQMTQALENVMFLPYALVVDLWKWRYFSGQVPKERLNEDWWHLRSLYQGIGPSVTRTESDTDALSKYHAVKDIGYIRYFISFLLKFQFYKAMCDEAGHVGPLASCDFYGSKSAGDRLRRMLEMGRSKPWPEALKQLTGREEISAQALLEYFEPLHNWLKEFNAKNSVPVGWSVPENPMESASA